MPDPEELLAAEAGGQAVPGVTLPGEVVGPPAGPKNVVVDFLGRMWGKLTAPTEKKPEDYKGRMLAEVIHFAVDKGEQTGPSRDNLFGESVDLAVEHLMAGEGGGNTPLGYLTTSTYGMISDKRQMAKAKADAAKGKA